MIINDDGTGFEFSSNLDYLTGQHKFGLTGIDERVRLIGGRHTIESAPNRGTILMVELAD